MEKYINWLKAESQNKKQEIDDLKRQKKKYEEVSQMKSSIEHFQDQQHENYSINQAMGNVSYGISNKRTARAVTSKPGATKPTTKPETKPSKKFDDNYLAIILINSLSNRSINYTLKSQIIVFIYTERTLIYRK